MMDSDTRGVPPGMVPQGATERRRADDGRDEEVPQVDFILDSIPDGFLALDREWRFTYLNAAAMRVMGPREALLGRVYWEVYPATLGTAVEANYRRAIAEQKPIEFESYYEPWGRWLLLRAYPWKDGLAVYFRDLTEEMRLREEREEALATLDALVRSAPLGICALDHDLRYRLINGPLAEMNGIPAEGHIGRTIAEVVPDLVPAVEPIIRDVLASRRSFVAHEIRGETPKAPGVVRTWEESWFPIPDGRGGVRAVGVIVQEVTERKRAEEEARTLHEKLRFHVENSPLAVVEWDHDFVVTGWNHVAERMFGWAAAEVVGKRVDELNNVYEEDWPHVQAVMAGMLDGTRASNISHNRNYRKDGSVIHCVWHNSSLRDETGRLLSVLSLVADITQQKQAEERLRLSEERFRLLAEANPIGIVHGTAAGGIRFCNDAYCSITGYAKGDFESGRVGWVDITPPEWVAVDRQRIAEAKVTGFSPPYEKEYVRKDGARIPVLVGFAYVDAGREEMAAFVVDLSAQRRAEVERERLLEQLRQADRRKDEFLATLAHELRNPLAPIRNAVQLIQVAGDDPETLDEARSVMERQLKQMVRLIDDLLDVSRISRGKIRVSKERVELKAMVESAVEATRPLIASSNHKLTVAVPPGPIYLDADPARLAQVFANLLGNAAKYTEPGGHIWLTAGRQGGELVVSVRDTGIGISTEHLPHVFAMFSQVAPGLERSQGGLGIGLSLVKGLVEMHGGHVEARSEGLGKGSEFTVYLPVARPPKGAQSEEDAETPGETAKGSACCRILIVDDNRDSADLLARYLRRKGHEVQTAYDGVEAVQAAGAFRPHVVLLDIGLPKMNGYEAAAHIRRQPWGKDMLLSALTGWGQEDDKRRALEAGFNHHMTKPVDPAAVENLLATLNDREPS